MTRTPIPMRAYAKAALKVWMALGFAFIPVIGSFFVYMGIPRVAEFAESLGLDPISVIVQAIFIAAFLLVAAARGIIDLYKTPAEQKEASAHAE